MFKSPTIIMCGAMYILSFSKVSFMNMGTDKEFPNGRNNWDCDSV